MDFYEKTVVVGEQDLDDLNHVNNIRYIEWIQDISKEHWEKRVSKSVRDASIWVVRSHHIEYKNEARLGDVICIKTYIAETRGAISVRAVEMYHAETKKELIRSQTEWCLLNAKSFKPMRISEEIRSFFNESSKMA